MEIDNRSQKIIRKLAWRYVRKFPPHSIFKLDDLIQEGWEVYAHLLSRKRYRPHESSFQTWLWRSVNNKFSSLLRNERVRSTRSENAEDEREVEVIYQTEWGGKSSSANSPERMLMVFEALEALSETNIELAEMIVEGVPKNLSIEIRKRGRIIRHRRGWNALDGKIRLTKQVVEKFFHVKLEKLTDIVYNRL